MCSSSCQAAPAWRLYVHRVNLLQQHQHQQRRAAWAGAVYAHAHLSLPRRNFHRRYAGRVHVCVWLCAAHVCTTPQQTSLTCSHVILCPFCVLLPPADVSRACVMQQCAPESTSQRQRAVCAMLHKRCCLVRSCWVPACCWCARVAAHAVRAVCVWKSVSGSHCRACVQSACAPVCSTLHSDVTCAGYYS
ncbi:hypothetical protein COO60DRAFT_1624020 [Scenedesmus sp. NREL 46B-D3]|nr:hypothetical protein COO60DRAFT_1624020 [Scenedesmus sp. NREL 46B-D3]